MENLKSKLQIVSFFSSLILWSELRKSTLQERQSVVSEGNGFSN